MTREEAESELMQIYGSLSEEKKQALDVLMAQNCDQCEVGNPCLYCEYEFKAQADGEYITQSAGDEIRQKNYDLLLRRDRDIIRALPSVNPQEPCEDDHDGCKDCKYETYPEYYYPCCECKQNYMDMWKAIPSAEPKTGRWIIIDDCEKFIAKCSECGQIEDSRMIGKYAYCHCGARMVEPQESEVRNG